jgi:hypothetical protein
MLYQKLTETINDENNAIYNLSCSTCHSLYVGQPGHSLKQRYLEHIQYLKYNNLQFACVLHFIQNVHEYGPLQDTMTLLQHTNEHLGTILYSVMQTLKHLNNRLENPLFTLVCDLQLKHATT